MTWLLALLLALAPIHASVEPGRAQSAAPGIPGPWVPPAASQGELVGIASWYGTGSGVATQWCSWTYRHSTPGGCGFLAIQSHDTGLIALAPVIDWCQCYPGTPQERIVDLQLGVVAALGLDPSRGLYQVTTWPVDGAGIPDTAMQEIP
jgi:hypothetical protein